MRLAGAVGTDQSDSLAVVDLVAERQEQIADRHVGELHDSPRGVGAAQLDEDVLVGHGRRGRAGLDELLPAGLGGVRPSARCLSFWAARCFMIFMWRYRRRSSSFHRWRSSPSCSWRLARASGNVRYEPPCTQHPEPSTQITLVATFESSVRSWLTIRIVDLHALIWSSSQRAGRHVEVVVGLVEQQHVGAAAEQHVEHESLAFATAQLADRAGGEVVDRASSRCAARRPPTRPPARTRRGRPSRAAARRMPRRRRARRASPSRPRRAPARRRADAAGRHRSASRAASCRGSTSRRPGSFATPCRRSRTTPRRARARRTGCAGSCSCRRR